MKDLKRKVLDIIQEEYPELRKEEKVYEFGDRFIINSDFFDEQYSLHPVSYSKIIKPKY